MHKRSNRFDVPANIHTTHAAHQTNTERATHRDLIILKKIKPYFFIVKLRNQMKAKGSQ